MLISIFHRVFILYWLANERRLSFVKIRIVFFQKCLKTIAKEYESTGIERYIDVISNITALNLIFAGILQDISELRGKRIIQHTDVVIPLHKIATICSKVGVIALQPLKSAFV